MNTHFRLALLPLLLSMTAVHAAIVIEDRSLSSPQVPSQVSPGSKSSASATLSTHTLASTSVNNTEASAPEENNNSWELYNNVQRLQDEIAQLRGLVEQQGFLIEKLQNDLRSRYVDIDQRLNTLQEQQQATTPAATEKTAEAPATSTSSIEEERKAYLAAYDMFRSGGADKAIPSMLAFVKRYPNSSFTPGAYYWLGEFYLNANISDPVNARKSFETVLSQYPEDARAPASLYKIASILDLQGKPQEASLKMKELLSKYPKSSEAPLAQSYLKTAEPAKPAATPTPTSAPAASKTTPPAPATSNKTSPKKD